MTNKPKSEEVLVSIVNAQVKPDPPAWRLEYEVQNLGTTVIYLIVDESMVFRRDGMQIELSYAREKMQPDVHVFGYFDPIVEKMLPDGRLIRSVEVIWPIPLSDIWNPEREAVLPPGEYEVSVRVGYAMTPEAPAAEIGESIETPVLRWQKQVVSPTVRLSIPPYGSLN